MVNSGTASIAWTGLDRDNSPVPPGIYICQLELNVDDDTDFLIAKSIKNDWVEVVPPDKIDLYVHTDFLNGNLVTARKLNVRAGAGINWSVVGELGKGDTVVARGTFGDWTKIAPPSACSLWVAADLVESAKAKKPKRTAKAKGSVDPRTDKPVKTIKSKSKKMPDAQALVLTPSKTKHAPPPDLVLIPLEGQGQRVQKKGLLKKVGFVVGKPARFRLVTDSTSRAQTICFVRGNFDQLSGFLGQTLIVRGRHYGYSRPR